MADPTQRPLVVFDFDWTLVNENSDTVVVRELGVEAEFLTLLAAQTPWTTLMDKVMMAAFRSGNNERDIVDALKEVPVERAMLRVVRAMAAAGVEMVIVSDANSMFIEKILAHHGVGGCFSEVNTNEGKLEGGALRVLPHHQGPPHNCVLCPENLCKGMVLDKLRAARPGRDIIYLGDGNGDFCPSARLGPGDHVLPREGYPLLERVEKARAEGGMKAQVHSWASAEDAERVLTALLALPPLAA
eukprot:CAMPEP_0182866042 /NCGR_PEP_ID=MMETSP0034_2-20130328/8005_1 /TAXON_ID=156128 /ORGANISM="Nephroselmis pyriformis, Strain CCMP717" /LENGTH=243 /DNA_ID=CAMNT_0024998365 /DNA_START=151 /DNA_END=882 /DNA_ORIENTATION=+